VSIHPATIRRSRLASSLRFPAVYWFCACLVLVLISAGSARPHSVRVDLLPKLRAGQILTYDVSYSSDKQVNADSPAVPENSPDDAKVEVHALLRIEILDLQTRGERFVVRARARFDAPGLDANSNTPASSMPASPQRDEGAKSKAVEFTILPDGRIEQLEGLDSLYPDQQQAWQEWASRFALPRVFPGNGVKLTEKVKSQEAEASPSPIAGLRWLRESVYVRNEPCSMITMTSQGELTPSDTAPDTCAVILTTATLRQQSSRTNATPNAFKIRELRTTGTARGTNRIITYVSLKTGLVVRATEEANQNMDVTIAKADAPNRVHYNVVAKSHSEVLLVSESR
jgi:hypothetical protein